ncbi:uncharacterized protein At5g41620-like isoform X2 [Amaranthus tricolor]|uniref:uncharacterized protein At5g41620-like isoform X2 n=1 Tax=Amaranthus tricolor TaxID=29722 RepID=UPI002590D6DB|nr:uncharacterized protein At5g41620-like isoform X2 [Amaranthus tricolor]
MTRKERTAAEKKEEFFRRKKYEKGVLLLAACKRVCGSNVSTPVISWKEVGGAQNTIIKGTNSFLLYPCSFSAVQYSARKLGSALWEFHHYSSSARIMHLGVNNHHHQKRRNHHHRVNKFEGFDVHHQLNQNSLAVDAHGGAAPDHQLAPYNPAATPGSSVELRERMGEPSYSFKSSAELLKILNRIWTLEEQHASNVSLVKALNSELVHSRGKIKELLRDQQESRREIDELMNQLSLDNRARKSKEKERLEAALQSVRDELEDERKLRKRSESLHRKLARELFEIKVALSTSIKELEKERKSSALLEELCDEFAKSIREYAKQVHDVKQKSDRDWSGVTNHDNLILHISESWLDERTQRRDREAQRSSVMDKLRAKIETFLTALQTTNVLTKDTEHKESRLRRRSLESIPEFGTTPEDSAFSDARCKEISKIGLSHYEEQEELTVSGKRLDQSPSSVQMSAHQNTPREIACEGTPTEISMLQKSDIYDSYQKKSYDEEGQGSNSKTVDKLLSDLLLSGGGCLPPEYDFKGSDSSNSSALRRHASPVRQWMTSMKSPGPRISESPSKPQSARENSLKAKLQEPKSKGPRSRLKILKSSS